MADIVVAVLAKRVRDESLQERVGAIRSLGAFKCKLSSFELIVVDQPFGKWQVQVGLQVRVLLGELKGALPLRLLDVEAQKRLSVIELLIDRSSSHSLAS